VRVVCDRGAGHDRAVGQPHALVVHRRDRAVDDPNPAGGQALHLLGVDRDVTVAEQHHVVRPLSPELRHVDGHRVDPDHADRPIADLPAVAVRAMQHRAAPALGQTRDVGQFVAQPGSQQDPPGSDGPTVVECDHEARRQANGPAGDHATAVPLDLLPADLVQLGR